MSERGGLLVLTGEGKGKTTAALGLALRFLGRGEKVRVIQFMKGGGFSGELFVSQYFGGNFQISQFGGGCRFAADIRAGRLACQQCGECFRASRDPAGGWAKKAMDAAWEALRSDFALIVLDEVAHALRHGLLAEAELLAFARRAAARSLVFTGRCMPAAIMRQADAATECLALKHYKKSGLPARRGVEY
jgi:cob(I)alamin adenosyltransferase